MTFVITQSCCNDAHCVSVCPVNCIHPTPDEPDFATTEQLYVDPRSCIDCGACASACPVDAIFPAESLSAPLAGHAERNEAYFDGLPVQPEWAATRWPRTLPSGTGLRVAVIGTGPAACYTAQTLLRTTDARVTIIEREDLPGGLVRYGVAPDHPTTKRVSGSFAWIFGHERVTMRLRTEVGRDVSLDDLRATHHAVVAAVGAVEDRRLDIPGEQLPGVIAGGDFARWVNGHPAAPPPDLTSSRAVVIGNGNVALDVARLLAADPDSLPPDLAPHVKAALRRSRVREVVVLGRRGPEHAAYTGSELTALRYLPGVSTVVDDTPGVAGTIEGAGAVGSAAAVRSTGAKAALLQGIERVAVDWSQEPTGRRIVLRFGSAPLEVRGVGRATGVALDAFTINAGLVVTSIGRRGRALAGLPFDESQGTVPHSGGRVVDPTTGQVQPGLYVAGWIKRGSTGGIGANRFDAEETVGALVEDGASGRLPQPTDAPRWRRLLRLG